MAWLSRRCPVPGDQQEWVERSTRWLAAEFGAAVLHRRVVLPTPEFFPGAYSGDEQDVRRVLDLVCGYMEIAPDRVELEFYDEVDDLRERSGLPPSGVAKKETAGHYVKRAGKAVIGIRSSQARMPMALVAVIAHELGHVRLLGEQRLTSSTPDNEPLTDLLTIVFGLGIFTANAAFDFSQDSTGWRWERLGYLDEKIAGYALAYYAWLRGERSPEWARHLDANPKAYLRQGLRYLDDRGTDSG